MKRDGNKMVTSCDESTVMAPAALFNHGGEKLHCWRLRGFPRMRCCRGALGRWRTLDLALSWSGDVTERQGGGEPSSAAMVGRRKWSGERNEANSPSGGERRKTGLRRALGAELVAWCGVRHHEEASSGSVAGSASASSTGQKKAGAAAGETLREADIGPDLFFKFKPKIKSTLDSFAPKS
jgi:hypothetical protein